MSTRFSKALLTFELLSFRVLLLCLALPFASEALFASSSPTPDIPQWDVFEAQFTSTVMYQNPFQDVTVTVEFTAPDGKHLSQAAFWDGANVWRLRFSPEKIGEWSYQTHTSPGKDAGLDNQTGAFRCTPYTGKNALFQHGSIRVSANHRHLESADGTPFFWLSDTVWNGPLKADPASWQTYLNDRQAKKFTVVQFVMTQWVASAANADGRLAYEGVSPVSIDPVFFQWMDAQFRAINDHGLVAAPVMIWTAPWSPFAKFLNPGNSLPEDQIVRIARYMAARYGAYQVIWILAGDGDYQNEEAERWKRIGEAVFGDNPSRVVTIHPAGQKWVGAAFANEPWFGLIGYQSGHSDASQQLRWLWQGPPSTEWTANPVHPIINLEPNYENHMNFNSHLRFDAHAVRRAAYWSLLCSPPAGVTYGAHGIWSWETRPAVPMNHPDTGVAQPWFDAIHLPGSSNMKYLYELFTSLSWWTLLPVPALIVDQPGDRDAATFVAAARSQKRDWALLYFPVGQTVHLKVDELMSPNLVRWFNPRSGQWSGTSSLPTQESTISPPDNQDWIAWIGADRSN